MNAKVKDFQFVWDVGSVHDYDSGVMLMTTKVDSLILEAKIMFDF